MPRVIHPMLATLVDKPFNNDEWLFEIKWDGYRAITYLENGALRFVSRNQNELTGAYPELQPIAQLIRAQTAVLDGEIVALDEQGRSSFSLMQQRTGAREGGRWIRQTRDDIPIAYYAFDLLYLDGYNLMQIALERRKELLRSILVQDDILRFSDHYAGRGEDLFHAAAGRQLEGIIGKLRSSRYVQKRSRDWLKMKIVKRHEFVIGGYTDPRGSRENFGSLVLGLYNDRGQLIPVGQAGSGFTQQTHAEIWKRLEKLEVARNPFTGVVESTRRVHYVKPELVAEIKFSEWTHEGQSGAIKMRAPVFEGLRFDKKAEDCKFEFPASARGQVMTTVREKRLK